MNDPMVIDKRSIDYKPILSIVIPAWIMNRELLGYVQECLQSIKLNSTVPYELILVDNGSSYGKDLLKTHADVYIGNDENRGYGPAVNQGYRFARGKYVCVMNDDIVVGPRWDHILIDAVAFPPPEGAFPCIATPALLREDLLDEQVGIQGVQAKSQQIVQVTKTAFWRPTYPDLGEFEPLDGFGALYLGEKALLDQLCYIADDPLEQPSLLDEGFEMGMFEDRDLWLRANVAGVSIVRSHLCWVYHVGNATWGKLPNQHEIYSKNMTRFYKKAREAGYARVGETWKHDPELASEQLVKSQKPARVGGG